jgi:hypothetical protein
MVQYIGTLEGCRLRGCCCKVYDRVCRAEGFGLLLAKGCDSIASLIPCKQKHPLKLSAYMNRTAVYASSGMWP